MNAEEAVRSMIEALGLEIEEVKKGASGRPMTVRNGERVSSSADGWLYSFPLHAAIQFPDDTPVQIRIEGKEVEGYVVSLTPTDVVLCLRDDMGAIVRSAELLASPHFLLERLRDKLQSDLDEGRIRVATLAASMIGAAAVPTAHRRDVSPQCQRDNLNDPQWHAVVLGISQPVTFIWGPPGTGKTYSIARIAHHLFETGQPCLLVSNTNVAVNTALNMIVDLIGQDRADGTVVRVGNETQALKDSYHPLTLDATVERRSADLIKRREQVRSEQERAESERRTLETLVEAYDNLASAREAVGAARQEVTSREEALAQAHSERRAAQERVEQLRQAAARAAAMTPLRRLLTRQSPDRINRHLQTELSTLSDCERRVDELKSDLATARRTLSDLEEREQEALAALGQPALTQDRAQERLQAVRAQLKRLASAASEIEQALAGVRERVLNQARIVATTVYKRYLIKELSNRTFSTVIIDEASMVALPLAFCAGTAAVHQLVVTGDYCQLPAIVLTADGHGICKEWLKRDVFEAFCYKDKLKQRGTACVALAEQYRMAAPIRDMVNRICYDKEQNPVGGGEGIQPLRLHFLRGHLGFLDSSSAHSWCAMPARSRSRYNLTHALTDVAIAEGVLEVDREAEVAIITPYVAQADLVNQLLQDRASHCPELGKKAKAATVHRFQGQGRPVVIFDVPDATGAPVGKLTKGTDYRDDAGRLLTVAVSRAEQALILVGDLRVLEEKLPNNALLRDVIEVFRRNGEPIPADAFLPTLGTRRFDDALQAAIGVRFVSDKPDGAYGPEEFYGAFLTDCRNAKRSVVIASPYVSASRLSTFADLLRDRVARGISIRIITQPPGVGPVMFGDGAADLLDTLREEGVDLEYRAHMHEKFALIDGRALWLGSLNILSHSHTSEIMIRWSGRETVHQLCRMVSPFPTPPGQDVDLSKQPIPCCPDHGCPMVLRRSRRGPFFSCVKYPQCRRTLDPRDVMREPSAAADLGDGHPTACPKCGATLVARRRRRGGAFLGCSRYPECNGAVNLPRTSAAAAGEEQARQCPACGRRLVLRSGRRGKFWGCSGYPRCRHSE